MAQYEAKKSILCPRAIFYDDHIKVFKKSDEIIIPIEEIDHIDYAKPSLFGYLFSIYGGVYPGRLEIRLNKNIGGTRLYLIKVKYKEIYKLPRFYKIKIGYSDYLND